MYYSYAQCDVKWFEFSNLCLHCASSAHLSIRKNESGSVKKPLYVFSSRQKELTLSTQRSRVTSDE